MKRKRPDLIHDDKSTHLQDTQTARTQIKVAEDKSNATTKRVANNRSIQSDNANAKPTTKARPSQLAKNVIDLTEDDEATSSKKPKKPKPAKDVEKRLKA